MQEVSQRAAKRDSAIRPAADGPNGPFPLRSGSLPVQPRSAEARIGLVAFDGRRTGDVSN